MYDKLLKLCSLCHSSKMFANDRNDKSIQFKYSFFIIEQERESDLWLLIEKCY